MSNSPIVTGGASKTIHVDVGALLSVKQGLEIALSELKTLLVTSADAASSERINSSIPRRKGQT